MLIFNERLCTTIEELEEQIDHLSPYQKQCARNDFYGIKNEPIRLIRPISSRQLRLSLVIKGIAISQIEEIINSIEEPERSIAQISWEYSTEFERNHHLVDQIGAALELTKEQIDEIFIAGAVL